MRSKELISAKYVDFTTDSRQPPPEPSTSSVLVQGPRPAHPTADRRSLSTCKGPRSSEGDTTARVAERLASVTRSAVRYWGPRDDYDDPRDPRGERGPFTSGASPSLPRSPAPVRGPDVNKRGGGPQAPSLRLPAEALFEKRPILSRHAGRALHPLAQSQSQPE